jgi:hypothetical protein
MLAGTASPGLQTDDYCVGGFPLDVDPIKTGFDVTSDTSRGSYFMNTRPSHSPPFHILYKCLLSTQITRDTT